MSDQKQAKPPFEVMTPDVFVGGAGHVVICQEWTSAKDEEYTRVLIDPRDAEALMKILTAAREARAK
jgi:hypothetical protein